MTTKRVEVRVVDNGYVIIWDDDAGPHEEIIGTKIELRDKLTELFA